MEGGDGGSDLDLGFNVVSQSPLSCVSLSAFSSPRSSSGRGLRLSSCISDVSRAAPAPRRKLAWVSLQGRLVEAEEASSTRTIGGGLSPEESVAWELFSPLQRVMVVAIVAAASADAKKSRHISQLQKSVDIRDMVLTTMQQKLDDLCDQMDCLNDRARDCGGKLFATYDEYSEDERLEAEGGKVAARLQPRKDDFFVVPNSVEQEERRMSDLSYCSSAPSSMDIQLSTLAAEQDFYNLRRECEEKDEIIQELTAAAHESSVASSKRISELEDILRRKNMVITKLKKDMRRPSFAASGSSGMKLPVMSNNLLYDMSSSSPSSSDSDSSSETCKHHSQSSAVDETEPSPSLQDPVISGSPQRGNCSDGSNLVLGSMRGMRRTPRRRWL
ncbi:unnamed protein product [Spirodela intermedia]|uniref:Uncharacterized protein n=2 Tax=Spirodela intermedia TaxID=51605 RepID=A0A7I8JQ84_SPIIN|nr:unnamed protein product [Spirodela intermedia]CAA6672324.1 unnamed protein product [Spirodela intermedia]CAA7409507.1 unnamed protein product [Spirodela intermedia]